MPMDVAFIEVHALICGSIGDLVEVPGSPRYKVSNSIDGIEASV